MIKTTKWDTAPATPRSDILRAIKLERGNMKIKYRTYLGKIAKVEVDDKGAVQNVWIDGENWNSSMAFVIGAQSVWNCYYTTWAEAKKVLLQDAIQRVNRHTEALTLAMDNLERIYLLSE